MMDKEELINGYFEDSLSQDQLEEFQHLLQTDAVFAADLEFQKTVQESLKKENRRNLKQMFSTIASEDETPKTKTKVIQWKTWFAAASIVLVVGLGSWFFFFNDPALNKDELYATNFALYDNVVRPIERGNPTEDLTARAFSAYENKEYTKALSLFKQLKSEQDLPYIKFYEANLRMQLNQHNEAALLLKVYISNEGKLADRAIWYLALSHLKLGEIEESKVQLNKLIQLGSFKTKAAEELVAQLN